MFGNLGRMMKIAGEMRKKMPEVQQRIAESKFTAQAGGGVVTATVDGKLGLVDLTILPDVLGDPDMSAEMLADLVKAAVGAAQEQARLAAAEAMKELTGGMSIPGLDAMLP